MSNATVLEKHIDYKMMDKCLAGVVAAGDIVNLRFLFMPSSPFRADSTEDISTPKYAYLVPEDESAPRYQAALELVQRRDLSRYVREQCLKDGPPQLPWELVMALADNATHLGKYTSASQAYELLRIRRRMQEILLERSDALLHKGDMEGAVGGYQITAGLDYDYGAFPEPLPSVPNYQERAIALHGIYPAVPAQSLALQPDATLTHLALSYLLLNSEFAHRLGKRPESQVIEFLATLIKNMDPMWDAFITQYREACQIMKKHEALFQHINSFAAEALDLLFEELTDSEQLDELKTVPALLLGQSCQQWEWWQIIKHLAYYHPAAVFFVARQRLSATEEIIVPRLSADSVLAEKLGLHI